MRSHRLPVCGRRFDPSDASEQQKRVEGLKKAVIEKIAPSVVPLCAGAGRDVSRQILGVHNEICLLSQPRPIRTARTGNGWSPGAIADRVFPRSANHFYPLYSRVTCSPGIRSDPMALDVERLLYHRFETLRQSYTRRDTVLYTLGGLGADPTVERDPAFLLDTRDRVMTAFAGTLASPGMWIRDPAFGIGYAKMVYAEQSATFTVAANAATVEASRAWRTSSTAARVAASSSWLSAGAADGNGHAYATICQALLLRGEGGFGDTAQPRSDARTPLERAADRQCDVAISPRDAPIYRLSDDLNPLRADPAAVTAAGFARPILHLHGLATYGIAHG